MWVSWAGGILQAGQGTMAEQLGFASVVDPDPFIINAASLTSVVDAKWTFTAHEGEKLPLFLARKVISCSTKPDICIGWEVVSKKPGIQRNMQNSGEITKQFFSPNVCLVCRHSFYWFLTCILIAWQLFLRASKSSAAWDKLGLIHSSRT